MTAPIFTVVIPLLATTGIGYFWARSGRSLENSLVTSLVMDTPCLILATFLRTAISPASFASIASASVIAFVAFMVVPYPILHPRSLRV